MPNRQIVLTTAGRKALKRALIVEDEIARFGRVRCVLANYGDVLGLTMADSHRIIEENTTTVYRRLQRQRLARQHGIRRFRRRAS